MTCESVFEVLRSDVNDDPQYLREGPTVAVAVAYSADSDKLSKIISHSVPLRALKAYFPYIEETVNGFESTNPTRTLKTIILPRPSFDAARDLHRYVGPGRALTDTSLKAADRALASNVDRVALRIICCLLAFDCTAEYYDIYF